MQRHFTLMEMIIKHLMAQRSRDYIHVEDLAQIHFLASKIVLKKKIFKIFNCGYGNGFSVMQILKKI